MANEENKSLKILAIQMSSVLGDKEANFHKVMDLVHKNIKKGTDIVILPEVWNVGWKPSIFKENAEDIENSETIEFLSEIAIAFDVNIIGGSFITRRQEGQKASYYNTCPVIDRDGELVATYDKMHLFSYYGCDEGKFVRQGERPVMINYLPDSGDITAQSGSNNSGSGGDGVNIGLSICYDIRFPEIYRAYRKAGADLLINMAAWPMSRAIHWESLSKARAIENQSFMLALTQSGLIENDEYNLGHSRVIDFNGEVVSEIQKGEGAILTEIKFKEMYEFREKCTVLLDIHDTYDVK